MKKKTDGEIVAVIMAAISMYLSSRKFRIVSIEERSRKINRWKRAVLRSYWRNSL